jgi:hypothetical protein
MKSPMAKRLREAALETNSIRNCPTEKQQDEQIPKSNELRARCLPDL